MRRSSQRGHQKKETPAKRVEDIEHTSLNGFSVYWVSEWMQKDLNRKGVITALEPDNGMVILSSMDTIEQIYKELKKQGNLSTFVSFVKTDSIVVKAAFRKREVYRRA